MINIDKYKEKPIQTIVIEDLDNLDFTIPPIGSDRNINVKLLNPNGLTFKINGTDTSDAEVILEADEYHITA